MDFLFDFFNQQTLLEASIWLLAGNIITFFISLAIGDWLTHRYSQHRVTEPPDPLTSKEVWLAVSTVILNAGVAIAGWVLWKAGYISVLPSEPLRVIADVFILVIAMDFGMYVTHWIAHRPWLYPLIHSTHHQYESPRTLSLFALNPFEVIGFGALWIAVLMIYSASGTGIILFLTLNLAFGTLGHVGVEPLPQTWLRRPLLNYLGTSTFHAQHHEDRFHNFGFYTLIWDHLFGTISPEYQAKFQKAVSTRING